MIKLLPNGIYQTPEGIRVPKVLVPYCGFEMLDDKMD